MPVLSSLVKDGSVTWSATAVAPARRLPPTMASLVTGCRLPNTASPGMSLNSAGIPPRADCV